MAATVGERVQFEIEPALLGIVTKMSGALGYSARSGLTHSGVNAIVLLQSHDVA